MERLYLETSVQFSLLQSWADGKGEIFQVKRKCCCKLQQDSYASPVPALANQEMGRNLGCLAPDLRAFPRGSL